ncbi:MAG: glucose-6-phosphate isomerase [Oleiphilaceae bacterium]|jgi:glucose-6-phosphate isomerase
MRLDHSPFHLDLKTHVLDIKSKPMREMFRDDSSRFKNFSVQGPHIFLDYSKNLINQDTLSLLNKSAINAQLHEQIKTLFSGGKFKGRLLNHTENRSVLHTALRQPTDSSLILDGKNIIEDVKQCREKMADFLQKIHNKEILGFTNKPLRTLVSIGIGGSFLGPKMVTEALKPYTQEGYDCHYLANIDGTDLTQILKKIDPETTLFLLQSKSFSTLETLENAKEVKAWLLKSGVSEAQIRQHFIAVTANNPAAIEFGIDEDNIFPMWDWVGGRYSLWSAIGLPIAFVLGMKNFEALLSGAHEMDQHFLNTDFDQNLPVIMALLGVWYQTYFGADSHAILPYDQYLQYFPDHLQQLDMESNGKHVDRDGKDLNYHSGPVIWGGIGCNGQHAYHQLLHQGTRLIPSDFIIPLESHHHIGNHHKHLFANCLSQSQALMQGKNLHESMDELLAAGTHQDKAKKLAPHKVIAGNKPSNTLILEKTTPESIGALIALYEHKVFVQSVLWNINAFDQWGVELGKSLSSSLYQALEGSGTLQSFDSSTKGLLDKFKKVER